MSGSNQTVRVVRCAGLERATEIKALFRRNGQENVAEKLDKAYPACGGQSWIAEDARGNVVMHLALFPSVIGDGKRAWHGALIGDLMADPAHRNFFGPLQLVRQLTADARAEGFEFLYSDPTPISAGLLKAAGFIAFGGLRRHVVPTLGPWRLYAWMRGARRASMTTARAITDSEVSPTLERLLASGPVRTQRTLAAYAARARSPDQTQWLWMATSKGRADALVLVRADSARKRAMILDIVWDAAELTIGEILLETSRWSSKAGMRWLDFRVFDSNRAARDARRIGFLDRDDLQPVVIRPLAERATFPSTTEWFITRIDGSAW